MFLIVLVILLHVFRSLENARTIVVVKILLHLIDGPQRMQGEHIGDGVHNHRTQWIQRVEMAALLGLLHRHKHLTISKIFIANHIDFTNFHLITLVDIDDHVNVVFTGSIGLLFDVDVHIEIAFVVVEILNDSLSLGQQVLGSDVTTRKVDFVTDIIGLTFLDTLKREFRHTRFFLDNDLQKDPVTYKISGVDGHVLKQTLFPNLTDTI